MEPKVADLGTADVAVDGARLGGGNHDGSWHVVPFASLYV